MRLFFVQGGDPVIYVFGYGWICLREFLDQCVYFQIQLIQADP